MPDWNKLTEYERSAIIAAVTHCDRDYAWHCAVSVYDKIREIMNER